MDSTLNYQRKQSIMTNELEYKKALTWLLTGETGVSSKAILAVMMKVELPERWSHPSDPADLRRCKQLLDIFPEWRARIKEMGAVSKTWANLAEKWNELEAMLEHEMKISTELYPKAPKTYEMMRGLIDHSQKPDNVIEISL